MSSDYSPENVEDVPVKRDQVAPDDIFPLNDHKEDVVSALNKHSPVVDHLLVENPKAVVAPEVDADDAIVYAEDTDDQETSHNEAQLHTSSTASVDTTRVSSAGPAIQTEPVDMSAVASIQNEDSTPITSDTHTINDTHASPTNTALTSSRPSSSTVSSTISIPATTATSSSVPASTPPSPRRSRPASATTQSTADAGHSGVDADVADDRTDTADIPSTSSPVEPVSTEQSAHEHSHTHPSTATVESAEVSVVSHDIPERVAERVAERDAVAAAADAEEACDREPTATVASEDVPVHAHAVAAEVSVDAVERVATTDARADHIVATTTTTATAAADDESGTAEADVEAEAEVHTAMYVQDGQGYAYEAESAAAEEYPCADTDADGACTAGDGSADMDAYTATSACERVPSEVDTYALVCGTEQSALVEVTGEDARAQPPEAALEFQATGMRHYLAESEVSAAQPAQLMQGPGTGAFVGAKPFLSKHKYVPGSAAGMDVDEDGEAVREFMTVLGKYVKECEKNKRYLEAEIGQKRLRELREGELSRRLEHLRQRHVTEQVELQGAYASEMAAFDHAWLERLTAFESEVRENALSLQQKHEKEMAQLRSDLTLKLEARPRFSRQLLELRRVEASLAKAKDFVGAQQVRVLADRLEDEEREGMRVNNSGRVGLAEQRLRQQQRSEAKAMRQRVEAARESLLRKRQQDLERYVQRFHNILSSLAQRQRCDTAKLLQQCQATRARAQLLEENRQRAQTAAQTGPRSGPPSKPPRVGASLPALTRTRTQPRALTSSDYDMTTQAKTATAPASTHSPVPALLAPEPPRQQRPMRPTGTPYATLPIAQPQGDGSRPGSRAGARALYVSPFAQSRPGSQPQGQPSQTHGSAGTMSASAAYALDSPDRYQHSYAHDTHAESPRETVFPPLHSRNTPPPHLSSASAPQRPLPQIDHLLPQDSGDWDEPPRVHSFSATGTRPVAARKQAGVRPTQTQRVVRRPVQSFAVTKQELNTAYRNVSPRRPRNPVSSNSTAVLQPERPSGRGAGSARAFEGGSTMSMPELNSSRGVRPPSAALASLRPDTP